MKSIFLLLTGVLLFVDVPAQHVTTVEPAAVHHSDKHIAIVVPSFPVSHGFSLQHKGPLTGFLDSKRIYSSVVKNHRLHGPWQSWYTGGRCLDSGVLQQGVPHGEWKHWDSAGNLLAIRHYDAVKLQRVSEEIRLHHPKRRFYALTSLYEKNRQAALWYLSAAGSFSFPRTGKPGLQELTENNSRGKGYHPVFESCLHHGLYMNFYTNGHVKDSGYYKDGLPDGIWLHADDESTWQGVYKNGVRTHEWKQFNKAGQLLLIIFYNRKGEEEGRREIRSNR
jgi:antitoxin component YwqK of YwqJK toxin-antitoxin module